MSAMPPTHWVHDLSPFLYQFSDTFGIRYYGLAYVLGFAAAAWLMHLYARRGRSQISGERVTDLMTYIVIGVLAGGRLGYFLLYQTEWLLRDPLALIRVWEGGMASHGGFVGVLVALWLWSRKQAVMPLHVADIIVTTAPVGLLFGRIANFINGELWGKVSYFKYAVIFPQSAAPNTPISLIEPRHASQLYQAALEGALLLAFMQWRFWKTDLVRTNPGRLSGEFLIAYSILRMIGEHFREPDATLLFGLSRGTFYSLFLILAGIWLIVHSKKDRPLAA
jgi:phosphatidylglycerol:prolipoprotein diacylglycerol transferase